MNIFKFFKKSNKEVKPSKESLLEELNNCNSLMEVFDFHKKIYNLGYTSNLGPCEYGMFRCESIETMKPEEVYLGGIWGLFTKNIPFWESHKEDKYGCNGFGLNPEQSLYEMILKQYKTRIQNNI